MIRLVLVIALLAGCHKPTPTHDAPRDAAPASPADARASDAAAPDTPNVLVILVDTVRADRLGVTGYRRAGTSLTPRLDAFAATALNFTHAYAQGSNTPRSVPAILTSRPPSWIAFHKTFHNFPGLLPENVLLFEPLADAGYHTALVASHFYFEPRRNVGQGVADYDDSGALGLVDGNSDYAAPRIVPKVLTRLADYAQHGTRFAMLVHLFEPHSTYIDHPEFPVTEKGEAGLAARYDYEIAIDDQWIGKILDALDAQHLSDHTIVVVLSDHGEEFGEHVFQGARAFFHGQTLYEDILRVPLLIRIPGVKPAVRNEVVSLLDVAPTILDAARIPIPSSFMGRSLLESHPPSQRSVLAEIQPTPELDQTVHALVTFDGRHKIIVTNNKTVEVYDLTKDPGEQKNLVAKDPKLTAELRKQLDTAFAR